MKVVNMSFSRIARVFKNDVGVREKSSGYSTWTSFLKSTLNCSITGKFPVYFDNIQSVTNIITGIYGGHTYDIVYAVFTISTNPTLAASAVCAFSIDSILKSFDGIPVHNSQKYYRYLIPTTVPGFFGHPFVNVKKYYFTKIVVDPQVRLNDGRTIDVLFLGTSLYIIKLINIFAYENVSLVKPIVIEEIQVFTQPTTITKLYLTKVKDGNKKLIILTHDEIKAIDLYRCSRATSCKSCVDLKDPYCGWYVSRGVCAPLSTLTTTTTIDTNATTREIIFQNISGYHLECFDNNDNNVTLKSDDDDNISTDDKIDFLPKKENNNNSVSKISEDKIIETTTFLDYSSTNPETTAAEATKIIVTAETTITLLPIESDNVTMIDYDTKVLLRNIDDNLSSSPSIYSVPSEYAIIKIIVILLSIEYL